MGCREEVAEKGGQQTEIGQPSPCARRGLGVPGWECSAIVSEVLGGEEGLGEGARMSLLRYRVSHTPGSPGTSGNSRQTPDLEPQ